LVRVTHRFHPWFGREFEFVKRRKNWRDDRVYFFDEAGQLASLPAAWTDAVAEDPFVTIAAGRSPFRTADLLKLTELVAQLGEGSGCAAVSVRRITS
jgi:Family of unknown function (DUF5372)